MTLINSFQPLLFSPRCFTMFIWAERSGLVKLPAAFWRFIICLDLFFFPSWDSDLLPQDKIRQEIEQNIELKKKRNYRQRNGKRIHPASRICPDDGGGRDDDLHLRLSRVEDKRHTGRGDWDHSSLTGIVDQLYDNVVGTLAMWPVRSVLSRFTSTAAMCTGLCLHGYGITG